MITPSNSKQYDYDILKKIPTTLKVQGGYTSNRTVVASVSGKTFISLSTLHIYVWFDYFSFILLDFFNVPKKERKPTESLLIRTGIQNKIWMRNMGQVR